jgi:hypothetical protein
MGATEDCRQRVLGRPGRGEVIMSTPATRNASKGNRPRAFTDEVLGEPMAAARPSCPSYSCAGPEPQLDALLPAILDRAFRGEL